MRKIHPVGNFKSRSDKKDEVDMMVRDVEDELEQFKFSGDKALKSMYDGLEEKLPQQKYYSNSNNDNDNDEDLPTSGNQEVEVKLSHEIDQDRRIRADNEQTIQNLRNRCNILMNKMKEYQKTSHTANSKLRHSQAKVAELEVKIDTMNEEALNLKKNLNGQQIQPNRTNRSQPIDNEAMKRAEQMRKELLYGENDDELTGLSFNDMNRINIYQTIKRFILKYLPFKRDLRTIQARFGSSVASYFIFQRLVFIKMLFIAIIMLIFAIYHLTVHYTNHNNTIQGYLVGEGYLPKFMEYSSFTINEKFIYSAVIVITIVVILIILCNEVVREHKNAITLELLDNENIVPYSKEILCCWDFSMYRKIDIEDQRGQYEHVYIQLLDDTHQYGIYKDRSNIELIVLYIRRSTGIILYLALVTASFTAIIYLTVYSSRISEIAKNYPGMSNIGSFISPISLQAINAIVPVLLELITTLENWDQPSTELQFLLFRVYISNTLNTLILTLSYIILADPILLSQYKNLRNSLELTENSVFSCRINQVSDGLFILLISTFIIQLISFIALPICKQIFAYIISQPYIKTEFNVADAMVKKFSFLGLVYVSFPFAPLSMIFVPIYLFITFKFEKYTIKKYYTKPKRPFKGQKAAFLYAIFYLLTYILVGLSVSGYFLTTKTLSKNCNIQDNYIGLCLDEVGDIGNNLCTVDVSSKYYNYWGKEGTYPGNVCESACGPFVGERSALSAFKDAITGEL